MTSKPRGLYRDNETDPAGASAYVSYGAHGFSVAADRYVDEGYAPPFDALPWKRDYDAAHSQAVAE